jgi:GNAT superfamily N-acetyltransferase
MTASPEASAAAHASQTRVPDFFIVGHPKCGTTALYEMLQGHPQIHMPVKEPWFFASDLIARPADGMQQRLEDYLSLFDAARPGQRVGEATPSYLRSRTAAKRIADLQPGARIIAILREPASFLRSFHLQAVQARVETEKDLRRALALEKVRREGKAIPRDCARPEALFYSEHVRYVEQLRRYYAVFPREQVLVLVYEDFRRNNEATVRQVLQFLEVDDTCPIEAVEANPTVRLRSRKVEELLRSLYQGQGTAAHALNAAVKAFTPRGMRRYAVRAIQRRVVYGAPGPPDESLMLELRHRFKGEVVALSEYLGRDLVALWDHDGVD